MEASQDRFSILEKSVNRIEGHLGRIADKVLNGGIGSSKGSPHLGSANAILRSGRIVNNVRNEEPIEGSNETPRERNNEEKEIPSEEETPRAIPSNNKLPNPITPRVPYLGRLRNDKMEKSFKDIYDVLSKVTINLPLLDAIQKMPAYRKFFKELNKEKYRYRPRNQERLDENASAVIQKRLPPKLKDPGSFIIGVTIGGEGQVRAMLDLGASINLMPFTIYKKLGLNELRPTKMSLILADQSARQPRGIVEDVLIQVDKLIIPADFVVFDCSKY